MDGLFGVDQVNAVGLDHDFSAGYWGSFNDCAPGLIPTDDSSTCFGVGHADLMISAAADQTQQHFFEANMEMDGKSFFGEAGYMQQQHSQDPMQSSSSLSSKQTLSTDSSEYSSQFLSINPSNSFAFDPADKNKSIIISTAKLVSRPTPHLPEAHDHHHNHHVQAGALARDDDMVLTKAMMAVISSASSTASSSPPPPVISPPRHEPRVQQNHANGQLGAFRPYKSAAGPRRAPESTGHHGQKMIKRCLSMSSRIASLKADEPPPQESRTANNQLSHVISERRRREKLNESFQTLRMLLPLGSKKDKTSMLINAANYLKTLEAQVSELEQKNRKLEACLPSKDGSKEATGRSNEKARLQIIKATSPTSQVQQINLTVAVMVECDMVDLVLHILECIKWMDTVSILSVDANTYSPQMSLSALASIKLQITDCNWNEKAFQEAMNKAVNDATSSYAA